MDIEKYNAIVRILLAFIFYCFLSAINHPLLAQANFVVSDANQAIVLSDSAVYFKDPLDTITIENFGKLKQQDFVSGTEYFPETNTVWFSFNFTNELNEPIYLLIDQLFINEIKIYRKDKKGFELLHTSGYEKVTNPQESTKKYLFKLPKASADSVQTVVGRASLNYRPGNLYIPGVIGSYEAVSKKYEINIQIGLVLLGIMVALFLYNALLIFLFREKVLLYYLLYLAGASLYTLYIYGFMQDWFWPQGVAFSTRVWPVSFLYVTLTLFSVEILEIRKQYPRYFKLNYVIIGLAASIIVVNSSVYVSSALMLLGVFTPIYLLTAAVLLISKSKVIPLVYLVGWIPLAISAVTWTLITKGYFFDSFMYRHSVSVGFVWEVIIFSLILGYRYNKNRQERFEIQKKNLALVEHQNERLEKKVAERTEEIAAQNEELFQQQEEISAQRDLVENQNIALQKSRDQIESHNKLLAQKINERTVELKAKNKTLKKQYLRLEEFSFIAAHNLRAPIARILGLSTLFNNSEVSLEEKEKVLGFITSSAKDLDEVVHDLNQILQLNEGRPMVKELVDVPALINKILNRLKLAANGKSILWNMKVSDIKIKTIPTYLDSILTNLISNSIKYSNTDKETTITVTFYEENLHCFLSVEDDGLGFDYERFKGKIFQPFQRFNDILEGKGLGLYLVKNHVESLSGNIKVESKPKQGTKVSIDFPM